MTKNIDPYKPRVSVILNTCNRGAYIGDTLEGLKQQTYDNFEVIVVNGPSIDNTEEVVGNYNVRYYTAPFNISVSRNVGIKHAAGEILAFIDDDAVPEPDWLKDIVDAYKDPVVGAAGGLVYNADGSDFQYRYGAIDIWGYPKLGTDTPFEYNQPNAHWYNINIGTNASYRREPLIEIGGFDEEIEYYHDESDVCVRMIDAGYKVAQLSNAFVHHKMAPSFRRKNSKKVVVWDAIVKNTIYYALKHTKGKRPLYKRLLRPLWFERKKFLAPAYLVVQGDFNIFQAFVRFLSLIRAFYRGYFRGFFQERKLLRGYTYEPDKFLTYKQETSEKPLNIVLVNQGFPPEQTDGNSRHNGALAKELASRGHRVSVIARAASGKKPTIIYKNGAWVYRHQSDSLAKAVTGFDRVDNHIAHAKSVYEAISGLRQKPDVILVPVWDVEGLAILKHKLAPTILSLMSPLKKVVETQWYWVNDPSYEITYALEKYCVFNADAVMPISNNIKHTIGEMYDIDWTIVENRVPVRMIPLGVDYQFQAGETEERHDSIIRVLYVGRFERRKGIDLLMEAIPDILKRHKNVEFDLVGDKDLVDENGSSYYAEFKKKYRHEPWFKRVHTPGFVSEEELADKYKTCDIFVAPSRYESFGQIYIEAMAAGKPVIGSRVGGIPEVVHDKVNGLLIKNEDAQDLKAKLLELIEDGKKREKMGKASKRIIEEKFSSKVWGDNFLGLVRELLTRG